MAKLGHKIDVFTTSFTSRDSTENDEDVMIHRYGTNVKLLTSNISSGMFYKPVKHDVDLMHTHFDIAPGPFAGLRYARKNNVPLVVTYHGDWVDGFGGIIRRIGVALHNKYLVDKILDSASVIISPSEYYIDESRFLCRYKDKIEVIPNGINLEDFDICYTKEECRETLGLPHDKKIVLFLSYLSPYKGPDVLVKAMQRILEEVPDTELLFVGEGVMRNDLELLSKRLGIEKHVKFIGFVGDVFKKALYYNAADVFCLPSTMGTDVFPLVLLEASASGLPMVVSDLNTFRCILEEGYNGFLTERGNEKNLADAIIYLLENDDVREEMGENAWKKARDYSWKKVTEMTEGIYNEVLS